MPAWIVFLLSGAAIVGAGSRLSRDADVIALRSGLGGVWVGAILVAAATSLPELTTDLFAVVGGRPNLAVGDLFGSSMANVLFLAIGDLVTRRVRVLTQVAVSQTLVGLLAIGLTATAAAGVLVDGNLTFLGLGWATIPLVVGYILGMRILHLNREMSPVIGPASPDGHPEKETGSIGRASLGFAASAIIILIAAWFLADSSGQLAEQLGIATGFVGVAMLAMVTSLPEAVVSIVSFRAGHYDIAVGNLLGSCCFNMVIFLPLDIANGAGSVLAGAQLSVLVAALFAILLISQILVEILNRSERRVWYVEPGPVFVILIYGVGLYLTYLVGH